MTDLADCLERRRRLVERMGAGVALVPTAPQAIHNTYCPYRYDSYFYYLTGFPEPEAVLLLVAGSSPKAVLFCRDKDAERELWDGFHWGPEAAREYFGMDEAYPISRLDELASQFIANQPRLFYALGADSRWDARVANWLNALRAQVRSGINPPSEFYDVRTILDEMRLIKSPAEQDTLRRAAEISIAAHRRAMRFVRPGVMEYEVEAELIHEFRRRGAQAPAYQPIVAAGANACVLHYVTNNARLNDGDLLLLDAGCQLNGYASDITRTFPINGKFSGPQQDLYELVLAAQTAAIEAVRPGNAWNAPHEAALAVLARGFIDFGLCQGTLDAVLEAGDYRRFYMHRTGHWLGLNVHDVGTYKQHDNWRALEAGMVLTVEPGCYVRPAEDVPKHYWDIGIRIEDDVIVTRDGCEIITSDAPKSVTDIESWMMR